MRPSPDKSHPKDEGQLPPECPAAAAFVNWTRASLDHFDQHGGFHPEDVVGCLITSCEVFRADYLPRGSVPTEDQHMRAARAVFRDFLRHGRDLIQRAGWWPATRVDAAERVAFSRFLNWRDGFFEPAIARDGEARTSDRGLHIRAIWVKHCETNATRGGRISLRALWSDVGKCSTEAGLRGADGRDDLTREELRSEAALIELAAERKDAPLIYYDSKGRGRISWRRAKDIHPNRGQRMPLADERRRIGKLVHGRGANGVDATPNQDEFDRELLAQAALRRDQEEAAALVTTRDESLDRETLLAGVREAARVRGPAAEAALAYLMPRQLKFGRRLSRREACATVTPPVTPDALRHQEIWLLPALVKIAEALSSK